MAFALGTADGVWEVDDERCDRIGLAGKLVTHVARRGELTLACVPGDGLYAIDASGERRVFEGDARACAIGPDAARYVGVEPAMLFRGETGGQWVRCDAIDELPTRGEWTFPPPPHLPHVLSIDFLPAEPASVLAGIEVGGVILSRDRGRSWIERNAGIYVDVHSVRPDPSQPGLLVAVTGDGFYASEDDGGSWEKRMAGVGHDYTVGMHVNPARARELLIAAGDRPPGLNGRIYHSLDAGESWVELAVEETRRVSVPFFAEGCAWLATHAGRLLRAEDPRKGWSLDRELPTQLNCVACEGSPSSVMH
jgi:hypothetical protein